MVCGEWRWSIFQSKLIFIHFLVSTPYISTLYKFTFHSQTEEEGREAEATQAPSINTRSRGARGVSPMYQRRGRRGRPQPIVWQEGEWIICSKASFHFGLSHI